MLKEKPEPIESKRNGKNYNQIQNQSERRFRTGRIKLRKARKRDKSNCGRSRKRDKSN